METSGRKLTSGRGDGSVRLRGLGTQTVLTGVGPISAFVLASDMTFSIGPAKIRLAQRSWVDPSPSGFGLVAEESEDRVTILGITVHRQSRASVLQRVEPTQ